MKKETRYTFKQIIKKIKKSRTFQIWNLFYNQFYGTQKFIDRKLVTHQKKAYTVSYPMMQLVFHSYIHSPRNEHSKVTHQSKISLLKPPLSLHISEAIQYWPLIFTVVTYPNTYYIYTKYQRNLRGAVIFHVDHLWNDPCTVWFPSGLYVVACIRWVQMQI